MSVKIKKYIVVMMGLICVACARLSHERLIGSSSNVPPKELVGYRVIWSGMGGGMGATNEVIAPAELPAIKSFTPRAIQYKPGFRIYASPVVFGYNNNQYVVTLWTNQSSVHVVTYTYTNEGELNPIVFQKPIVFDADIQYYKSHQLALAIEDGYPVLYVGHAKGIAKIHAQLGSILAQKTETDGVFYIRVVGDHVVYASKNKAYKTTADLDAVASVNLSGTIPNDALPIVVSGDYVYFPTEADVDQVDLDGFARQSTLTLKSEMTWNGLQRSQEFVGNLAAYNMNDGVIVAKKLVNQVSSDPSRTYQGARRQFSVTRYERFGNASAPTFPPFGYYTYLASGVANSRNVVYTQLNFLVENSSDFENYVSTNGDYSHSVLAVSGSITYLAEMYLVSVYMETTGISETPLSKDETNQDLVIEGDGLHCNSIRNVHNVFPRGVVKYIPNNDRVENAKFHQEDPPLGDLRDQDMALFGQPFFKKELYVHISDVFSKTKLSSCNQGTLQLTHVNYSNRFFVISPQTGVGLAVQNINESFFLPEVGNAVPIYSESAVLTDNLGPINFWNDLHSFEKTANKLNTYHSQVAIGKGDAQITTAFTDPDMEIHTIAIGKGLIILGGSHSNGDEGTLYYLD
jgi:hypothetical protein